MNFEEFHSWVVSKREEGERRRQEPLAIEREANGRVRLIRSTLLRIKDTDREILFGHVNVDCQ
jgi:hypothetical protein